MLFYVLQLLRSRADQDFTSSMILVTAFPAGDLRSSELLPLKFPHAPQTTSDRPCNTRIETLPVLLNSIFKSAPIWMETEVSLAEAERILDVTGKTSGSPLI